MSDLRKALDGPAGSLDMYLEVNDEAEVRADILALTGNSRRERFAAMAMQGILSCFQEYGARMGEGSSDKRAKAAVEHADALIAELDKVQS